MKAIPKTTQAEIQELIDQLDDDAEDIRKAIETYNNALTEHRDRIEAARTEYNERMDRLHEIYDELHGDAQSYYDERSEKWQQSDAGQSYEQWRDKLEATAQELVALDEIEIPDLDEPDLFDSEQWEQPENSPDEYER
jgi:chromosome segregation ATPase